MEHVCLVGFIRRRLDVHRSNKERHKLLGLEDLDTTVSHGGCEMPWSLDPAEKHVTFDGGVHMIFFFTC